HPGRERRRAAHAAGPRLRARHERGVHPHRALPPVRDHEIERARRRASAVQEHSRSARRDHLGREPSRLGHDLRRAAARARPAGRKSPGEPMSREKILIVDDEESILNQLKWGLESVYHVLTAATVDEAQRLLREETPSVVTLDLALRPGGPSDDGLRLLDEIIDRSPFVKVVM